MSANRGANRSPARTQSRIVDVVLMGEEIVVPRDGSPRQAEVHRRFTDLWKQVDGRWRLTARQATIIARP